MLTRKQGLGLTFGIGLGAALVIGFQPVAAQTDGQARLLELDGVAGQVEIRTSPGAAFNVQVTPGAKLSATTERDGIVLRVKGPIQGKMRTNCSSYNQNGRRIEEIKIDGVRYKAEDLPKIVVTGPSSMGLRIKRSLISGKAGDVGGATITMIGCGDFALGKVARNLELTLAGSGDFRTESVGGDLNASLAGSGNNQTGPVKGKLKLDLAGSGDTNIGSIGGRSEINLAGSGDVRLGQVQDDVVINLAGSGDTFIQGGRSRLEANIAGSGNIRHGGTVIDPQVNIIGSGDVSAAKLEGSPRVTKLGSGGFRVD
ncbi:DUF2807 domain-containing protein [Aquidulcibacter sp.]|uniref:GIN domain-containing protein n=1 Tax=Aquidulcibacter sp. TaxID=2052990 RepID=UPI0025BDFD9E|nr:DUF2807 domain-containing protein [Aquidulcibacter sp.]MCA3694483.1 DUF2807 domain-containing protein [Aquidulcibacter sp.]